MSIGACGVRICVKSALVAAVSSPPALIFYRFGDGDIAATANFPAFSRRLT